MQVYTIPTLNEIIVCDILYMSVRYASVRYVYLFSKFSQKIYSNFSKTTCKTYFNEIFIGKLRNQL